MWWQCWYVEGLQAAAVQAGYGPIIKPYRAGEADLNH